MERTIVASFATRREADLAVERLVQQHGIEPTDVSVTAPGRANSAGTKAAGADTESGHPGVTKSGRPQLAGPVEVSVGCHAHKAERVEAAFREAGAMKMKAQ